MIEARAVTAVTCLAFMLAGCGYERTGDTGYPAGGPASVTLGVSSPAPMTSAGDTVLVTAVAKDANGTVISRPPVTWRSSAPGVVTVSGSGGVAAVAAVDDGTAIITATSGNAQQTTTVTVRRKLVSIELSAPDSVIPAGSATQLTVVGRDARQRPIDKLTGVTFTSSRTHSVIVSPTGLVTALFSANTPIGAFITASVTSGGTVVSGTLKIDVASAAPPAFDLSTIMLSEGVRPEPIFELGQGIIFFTLGATRINYKVTWSLLTGPPLGAHIHGPDGFDLPAPVLVDLPLTGQAGTFGTVTGSFSAANIRPQPGEPAIPLDSLVTLMRTNFTYVDMHTTAHRHGEIRGLIR